MGVCITTAATDSATPPAIVRTEGPPAPEEAVLTVADIDLNAASATEAVVATDEEVTSLFVAQGFGGWMPTVFVKKSLLSHDTCQLDSFLLIRIRPRL